MPATGAAAKQKPCHASHESSQHSRHRTTHVTARLGEHRSRPTSTVTPVPSAPAPPSEAGPWACTVYTVFTSPSADVTVMVAVLPSLDVVTVTPSVLSYWGTTVHLDTRQPGGMCRGRDVGDRITVTGESMPVRSQDAHRVLIGHALHQTAGHGHRLARLGLIGERPALRNLPRGAGLRLVHTVHHVPGGLQTRTLAGGGRFGRLLSHRVGGSEVHGGLVLLTVHGHAEDTAPIRAEAGSHVRHVCVHGESG